MWRNSNQRIRNCKKMKVAVFSDCHGDLPNIDPLCRVVMICGDICPTRNHSVNYQDAWINSIFLPWIVENQFEKVILVPGNHDYIFESKSENYLRDLELKSNNILKILINEGITIHNENGNEIIIYGTPYCKLFGNWAFMRDYVTLKELYKKIPDNLDILLCHDAPDINGQGVILQGHYFGTNAGNIQLANAVLRTKPKRLFHGHIHSSPRENNYEGIIMNNVSLKDETYQSVFPVTIINL